MNKSSDLPITEQICQNAQRIIEIQNLLENSVCPTSMVSSPRKTPQSPRNSKYRYRDDQLQEIQKVLPPACQNSKYKEVIHTYIIEPHSNDVQSSNNPEICKRPQTVKNPTILPSLLCSNYTRKNSHMLLTYRKKWMNSPTSYKMNRPHSTVPSIPPAIYDTDGNGLDSYQVFFDTITEDNLSDDAQSESPETPVEELQTPPHLLRRRMAGIHTKILSPERIEEIKILNEYYQYKNIQDKFDIQLEDQDIEITTSYDSQIADNLTKPFECLKPTPPPLSCAKRSSKRPSNKPSHRPTNSSTKTVNITTTKFNNNNTPSQRSSFSSSKSS